MLTSAILLNGISCALLLRPPNPPDHSESEVTSKESQKEEEEDILLNRIKNSKYQAIRRRSKEIHLRRDSLEILNAINNKSKNIYLNLYQNESEDMILKELLSEDNLLIHEKQIRFMLKQFNETKTMLIDVCHRNDHTKKVDLNAQELQHFLPIDRRKGSGERSQNRYVQTLPFDKPKIWFDSIKFIVKNPMYLILLTTHVSFQWTWMTYQMVIYDFAIDQGMTTSQSVSLLTFFALSDLVGRLISGWIADRGLMKKNHVVSICILCIGFLIQLTSHFVTFEAQLFFANLLGFFCGVIIVLFNILSMEYVGLDHFPDALGLSAFFVGITSLARP